MDLYKQNIEWEERGEKDVSDKKIFSSKATGVTLITSQSTARSRFGYHVYMLGTVIAFEVSN